MSLLRLARAPRMMAAASVRPVPFLARGMQHKQKELRSWSKLEIEEKVLDIVKDHVQIPHQKVTLGANMIYDLLLEDQQRFGVQWDIEDEFDCLLPVERRHSRDFQSPREAADWVTAVMEETGRLRV
ncbi:hypothetical protein BJ742DRAFT_774197 [Cladochytrium replicatum]|nr:hypothetical protein BJ742DRAFT_774197 [Cladochytrium replicatum]